MDDVEDGVATQVFEAVDPLIQDCTSGTPWWAVTVQPGEGPCASQQVLVEEKLEISLLKRLAY